MTETKPFGEAGAALEAFAGKLFDDVRTLSADVQGVTRQGYGPVESRVVDIFENFGKSWGLETERDAAGNLWMTVPGKDRMLPAFVSGSHADSVPQGGNYDGLAGAVAALLVAKHMVETKFVPSRDYRVLVTRCEESSFFGKAYVGSLGMMGKLKDSDLALKHRTDNVTLGQCIASCGVDTARLTTGVPVIDTKKIAAFVELHIEQGPALTSDEKVRVGIVTGIRGNIRHKNVVCHGVAAHSGATDRPYRHDALAATVALLAEADKAWEQVLAKGDDMVFTVGVIKGAPTAAISVIPGEISFTVDIRSLSADTCEAFDKWLQETAEKVGQERGVTFEFDPALRTAPGAIDKTLAEKIYAAAQANGVACRLMASGAGHDAAVIGGAGIPSAMIFVANQKGSHNPHEEMRLDDFMKGADTLWHAVKDFDVK